MPRDTYERLPHDAALRLFCCLLLLAAQTVGAVDPDPRNPSEAELATLDQYAEKYNVNRVAEAFRDRPFLPDVGFSFVVWGDMRSNPRVIESLWAEIQNEDALFAIGTGDLVQRGYVQQWHEYFFPVINKYSKVPFLPVAGNHDLGDGQRREYKRIFGALDYAFDYGDAQFIVLDNNDGLTGRQLRWMEDRLRKANGKTQFVFAHKPPNIIEKWAYHAFSKNAVAFCALMTKYKVDTVFLGHIHAYSTAKLEGVNYVISGGGGAGLHSRYGPMGNVHHYCVVHVKGGSALHEVVRLAEDGSYTRSPGGNEFYQHPRELLSPEALAALERIAPGGEVDDVGFDEQDGVRIVEVELKQPSQGGGERDVDVVLREDGSVIEAEAEVFENELPSPVLRYVEAHFPGERFDDAKRMLGVENSQIEVTLEKPDGSDRDLIFASDGSFVEED